MKVGDWVKHRGYRPAPNFAPDAVFYRGEKFRIMRMVNLGPDIFGKPLIRYDLRDRKGRTICGFRWEVAVCRGKRKERR